MWRHRKNCSRKSQGQVFDSFPCITGQMPVPLFSRFCRGIECLFTLYSAKIFIFPVTTKYSSYKWIKEWDPVIQSKWICWVFEFLSFSVYPLYKGVPKRECLGTFFLFLFLAVGKDTAFLRHRKTSVIENLWNFLKTSKQCVLGADPDVTH